MIPTFPTFTHTLQYNTDLSFHQSIVFHKQALKFRLHSVIRARELSHYREVMIWPFERRFASAQQPTTVSFFPIVFICRLHLYKLPLWLKMEDNYRLDMYTTKTHKWNYQKSKQKIARDMEKHKNYIRHWNRLITVQSSRVISGAIEGCVCVEPAQRRNRVAPSMTVWKADRRPHIPAGISHTPREPPPCRRIDCSIRKKKSALALLMPSALLIFLWTRSAVE